MRKRLIDFLDPNRSITLFIIGTAALSFVLQALYDFFNDPWQWQGGYLLAIASLIVAVVALFLSSRQRPLSGQISIQEEAKPNPSKGLILLASPQPRSAIPAIEYHRPTLQHCWIIASAGSLQTARNLEIQYETADLRVHQGQAFLVDEDDIESTYDKVIQILEELPRYGLTISDCIADITGGLKPMTAGMTLAALARRCDLQYMKSLRDSSGALLDDAVPEPIRIDAAFVPGSLFQQVD
jgi:hypothetical protein